MNQEQNPHITALRRWRLNDDLKILHQWLDGYISRFVVLEDGHLYFYRVWGYDPISVSQDARIPVYDPDAHLADGLELFYIDPSFRAKSN